MQRDEAYRKRVSEKFDYILADEYQDVCYVQYMWLRMLGADHGRIFVVGDDDQAIYGFRSADIAYIRRFTRDFPQARQVRLEDNFRSTGHILAAANAVIALDPKRLGKTLRPTKAMGDPVEVVGFRNPEDEASGLAAEIKRRHGEGVGWEEMAVLYRSSFLSRPIEEALMRAHVPYVLVGDLGFYQRTRSGTRWRSCAWPPTPTTRSPTRRSAACATPPRAGSAPRRWSCWTRVRGHWACTAGCGRLDVLNSLNFPSRARPQAAQIVRHTTWRFYRCVNGAIQLSMRHVSAHHPATQPRRLKRHLLRPRRERLERRGKTPRSPRGA